MILIIVLVVSIYHCLSKFGSIRTHLAVRHHLHDHITVSTMAIVTSTTTSIHLNWPALLYHYLHLGQHHLFHHLNARCWSTPCISGEVPTTGWL